MKTLDRSAILAAQDLPITPLDVPEWGGTVHVRTMTGAERDAFELSVTKSKQKDGTFDIRGLKARLVALTLCDDEGSRLFGDDALDALNGKSAKVIDRLFEEAQRLNGLGKEAVEELVGN